MLQVLLLPKAGSAGRVLGRCRRSCRTWMWRSVPPRMQPPLPRRHMQSVSPAMERQAPVARRCACATGRGSAHLHAPAACRLACLQQVHANDAHLASFLGCCEITQQEATQLLDWLEQTHALWAFAGGAQGVAAGRSAEQAAQLVGAAGHAAGAAEGPDGRAAAPGRGHGVDADHGHVPAGPGPGRPPAVPSRLACRGPANSAGLGGRWTATTSAWITSCG